MRMYGIVMAGGGGTRLWPKSRENFPKQMHALAGDKPLVQAMTERLQGILGEDRVFIVTNDHHARIIQDVMRCGPDSIFIDPYRRDTGPAIGLAATYASKLDPDAVLGFFAADHFISGDAEFAQTVRAAGTLAADGHVVAIGINPTAPETGYGYIQLEPESRTIEGCEVHRAKRFVEKPNRETAEQYVASGDFVWNSGMFVWSIPTITRLFRQHLPDVYEGLMKIKEAIGTEDEEAVLHREYETMRRISIDYGIMEKLDDIMVVRARFQWSDIGSWTSVGDAMEKDQDGNAVSGDHVGLDTSNSLIISHDGKVIVTAGIDNMIIVDTPDALLVCPKDRAQDVKKIVDMLQQQGFGDRL